MVCVALVFTHLFICSGPNPAEQGWRSGPRWLSLSHQGQLSRETEEGEEGWSEGKRTDCLAGRCGADQFSPPADQSCPLALSVSADDTLSLPIGPFPGQEEKKRKEGGGGGGVCIRLEAAGLCVWGGSERTPQRLSELLLSNFPLPQDCRREAPQVSSSPLLLLPPQLSSSSPPLSPTLLSSLPLPLNSPPLSSFSPLLLPSSRQLSSPPFLPSSSPPLPPLSVQQRWLPPQPCQVLMPERPPPPPPVSSLPPSAPASLPANQKRHLRMSRGTHTLAQTHTQKFTNQKVYFLEADSQEKSSWKKLE